MSGDWLEGLAAHGCTFVELVRDGKRPRRTLDHYQGMTGSRGVNAARRWLAKGSPVGVMPRPRLWVLDADSPGQVERIVSDLFDRGITPLMVSTPSGGAHFYGILPDDFPLEGLKNHHPDGTVPIDYKFGPSTLIVCPGSRRKGIEYHPMSAWAEPPVMDPRWFKTDGFWQERDNRPFLTNQRPLGDRLIAARRYLEVRAPLSVSGKGGHRALARVCSHLVAYHRIPPRTALTMLVPWNARCTDTAGKPCPWSRAELMAALEAAAHSVPESGVKAYQRERIAHDERERIAVHVELVKAALAMGEASKAPVWRVRRLLRWFGLDLTEKTLGDALRVAGVNRVRATKARIWTLPGMGYPRLVHGLLTAKRTAQGTDLNKQGSVLPKICPVLRQVERIVSDGEAA